MAKNNFFKKGVSGVLAATTVVSSSVGNIANSAGVKTGIVKPNLEASGSNGGKFKLPAGIKYDDMKEKCADLLSAYTIIKYFPEKIKNLLGNNSGTEFTFDKFMNEIKNSSAEDLKNYFGFEIGDIISLTGWNYDKESATLTIYKNAGATASATWKDVDDIKNNVKTVVFKNTISTIDGNIFNDVNVETFDFRDYAGATTKSATSTTKATTAFKDVDFINPLKSNVNVEGANKEENSKAFTIDLPAGSVNTVSVNTGIINTGIGEGVFSIANAMGDGTTADASNLPQGIIESGNITKSTEGTNDSDKVQFYQTQSDGTVSDTETSVKFYEVTSDGTLIIYNDSILRTDDPTTLPWNDSNIINAEEIKTLKFAGNVKNMGSSNTFEKLTEVEKLDFSGVKDLSNLESSSSAFSNFKKLEKIVVNSDSYGGETGQKALENISWLNEINPNNSSLEILTSSDLDDSEDYSYDSEVIESDSDSFVVGDDDSDGNIDWKWYDGTGTLEIYINAGATASATWRDVNDICNNVKKVIIKGSVTVVEEGAFANLKNLEKVSITDERNLSETPSAEGIPVAEGFSLTIKCGAFSDCTSLTTIDFSGITDINSLNIDSAVFKDCPVTEIIVSDNTSSLSDSSDDTFDSIDDILNFVKNITESDNVKIYREPDYTEDYKCSIDGTFTVINDSEKTKEAISQHKEEVKEVVIGEDVKTVDLNIFLGCEKLTTLDLSKAKNIEKLSIENLSNLPNLSKVNLPAGTDASELNESLETFINNHLSDIEISHDASGNGWSYNEESKTLTIYKDAGATDSNTWKNSDKIKNNVQKVVFKKDVTKIDGSIFSDVSVKTFDFSDCSADAFKNITMENLLASSTDFEVKVPSTVLTADYLPQGILYKFKLNPDGKGNCFDDITKVKLCEYDGIGVLKVYNDAVTGYTIANDTPWNSVAGDIAYVYFPNDITRIGKSDFAGCTNLKVLDFSGITDLNNVVVDPDAFTGCNEIDTIIVNEKSNLPVWINNIRKEATVYSISEVTNAGKYYSDDKIYINYTPDGKYDSCVFPGKTSYQGELHGADESISSVKLILGSNRTTVPDGGFGGCSSLTSVSMPNVQSIGDVAFQQCESLTSVSMPNVTNIATGAFCNCQALTSVSMPNVETIGNNAFYSTGLTSVSMPNVTSIGNVAFQECESLISVSMPNVETIDRQAFGFCKNLKSVIISDKITNIGIGAFVKCESLEKIDLSGVTDLESLKPVYVDDEFKSGVASDAFAYCNAIDTIIVNDNCTSIDDIPDWVKNINSSKPMVKTKSGTELRKCTLS